MRLYKHLAIWEKAKLITSKQSAAIWEFEQTRGSGKVFLAFILLGIFCFGLGLIALISANWENISDNTKLISCFSLLGMILGCAYKAFLNQKENLFETLLFASFLTIGALIGLIHQIYHLSTGFETSFLIWALISLPVVVLSGHLFLPFIWTIALLIGLPLWNMLEPFLNEWSQIPYTGTFVAGSFFAALAAGSWYIRKIYPEIALSRAFFIWAVIGIYASFFIGDLLIRVGFQEHPGVSLTKSVFLILPFISMMTYISYITNHLKSFYTNILLGGVYFLSFYWTIFYSLNFTGAGLIFCGVLIISFAWVFYKIRLSIHSLKKKRLS